MIYEFQIVYRIRSTSKVSAAIAAIPLHTVGIRAQTENEAKRMVEGPGMTVVSVGPGRPILPEKPTYNLEEAAAYLDVSERTVRDLQSRGDLPRPQRNGHTVFRVEELEHYRSSSMQLGEWKGKSQ